MSLMRPLRILTPVSWLYGAAVAVRNACYDRGLLAVDRSVVPVISVGNLTAGGTGKTPLVMEIVRRLQRERLRIGVISRGYGRHSHGPVVVSGEGDGIVAPQIGGDEPVMIAREFPGVAVVVAERRSIAAQIAVQRLGVDILVMDDGYQHRALKRDLNILVVDGRKELSREPLLPAGLRREPLSALRRADLIAVAKVETPEEVETVSLGLRRWMHVPVIGFRTALTGSTDLRTGAPYALTSGTRAYALSGIGDHAGFLRTARSAGVEVVADRDAGDHHEYSGEEVVAAVRTAQREGCAMVVTTEKDAVRLRAGNAGEQLRASGLPFVVLHVTAGIFFAGEHLDRSIGRLLSEGSAAC